jgi:VacB/RNase II family 3'-5' exoribonuclease
MNDSDQDHRAILTRIAHRVMLERGLLPDFSPTDLAELDRLQMPAGPNGRPVRDLRDLLWASIDNDDSLDLDQLTVAESRTGGAIRLLVAVADVDALVKTGSAIDGHAGHNTTSIYTAAEIFPMLPEKLSTGLTSLNLNQDRMAIVVDMVVGGDGTQGEADIYQALVRNHAKLAYNSVAAWLEGNGPLPAGIAAVPGLDENLRLQDRAARGLHDFRHAHGALSLQTIESRPVFEGDRLLNLEVDQKNRAKDLIEDCMIAANGVTARFLEAKKLPSIRRVVRTPKRWERIVEIAREHNFRLPVVPDSKALEAFLTRQQAADPLRFPDLSLAIVKLMGAGEYVAEQPGDPSPGHFGLAVKDYSHSTAPNRRYSDLVTQRLLKAALQNRPMPYPLDELEMLATRCTQAEDAANKVERQVEKSAAALLLEERIGEHFDAIVTGASVKGTWVRLLSLPVEGRLVRGFEGVDVGDRVQVELALVDVEQGYIDFKRN